MKEINDQLINGIFLKPTMFTLFLALGIIIVLIKISKKLISQASKTNQNNNTKTYQAKKIMTSAEYSFYLKLKPLESTYKVIPQLNLASITNKIRNSHYYTDLFRNIDFAILSSDYSEVLLLIELNDATHNLKSREKRDLKVQKICNEIGIPLIKFYTKYANDQEYVLNRIIKTIEKAKEIDP